MENGLPASSTIGPPTVLPASGSHRWTIRSTRTATSTDRPLELTATVGVASARESKRTLAPKGFPVTASHRRTVFLASTVARKRPSELKVITRNDPLRSERDTPVPMGLLVAVSHNRTVLSAFAVTSLLSDLNANDTTGPTWPMILLAAGSPVFESHSRTVSSAPVVASRPPSGLNAIAG